MLKLNKLPAILPEYVLVDASWLAAQGYSGVQASRYAASGWLERPVRGVYMRPACRLSWQAVIVSLQTVLGNSLSVGGLSALEMQGYAHFIYPQMPATIWLHGRRRPPAWLARLDVGRKFAFRRAGRLFAPESRYVCPAQRRFWNPEEQRFVPPAAMPVGVRRLAWSEKGFEMWVSGPERAMLELLDEVPGRYALGNADATIDGLTGMNPQLLQEMLEDCRSVKVKRLALWSIRRHFPRLLDHIDMQGIDLGRGNRVIARGGFLDREYRITLPESMRHESGFH